MTDNAKIRLAELLAKIDRDPLNGKSDADRLAELGPIGEIARTVSDSIHTAVHSVTARAMALTPTTVTKSVVAISAAQAALELALHFQTNKLAERFIESPAGQEGCKPRDAMLFAALVAVYAETYSDDAQQERDDIDFHTKVDNEYHPLKRAKADFFKLRGFDFEEKYGPTCECENCKAERQKAKGT